MTPTDNNRVKSGKEDAVFEGRKKEDEGPPAMESTTSSSKSVTKDDGYNNGVPLDIPSSLSQKIMENYIGDRVCRLVKKVRRYGNVSSARMLDDKTKLWTILYDNTDTEEKTFRELIRLKKRYEKEKQYDAKGNTKVPATTTMVAPTVPQTKRKKKDSTTIDDAYSADEQQRIDDSFNATFRIGTENRSENYNHSYSKEYYYKRVWKNDPMNKKACWGTVVRGYDDVRHNRRWSVHFDDNTTSTWNSVELIEGRRLYEKKKKKDPSKSPLELRALHPTAEDLEIFQYEKEEKGTDDDRLMKNCKSVLYDPSLYTVAEWKSISRNIGTTDNSKWIAVDNFWYKKLGICPPVVLRAVGGEVTTKALTHKQKCDVRSELTQMNEDNEGHEGQPSFFDMFIKKDTDESQRICQIFYDYGGDARLVNNNHRDTMILLIPKLYFGVAKLVEGKNKVYEVAFIDNEERYPYTTEQYNAGRLLYEKTKQIYERRHGGGPDVPIGSFLSYEIEHSLDQRVKVRKVTNSSIGRELIGGDKNNTLSAYHFGTIVNVELDEKDPNEAKVTIMYDIVSESDDKIPWRIAHFYICDYNDHYDKKFPRSNCLRNRETQTEEYHLEVAGTEPLKEKKNDPRLCHETMFCNHGGGGGAVGSKMIHCKDMKGFEEHVDNANCYLSFDGHCILKDDGSFPAKHHLKASSGNRQKLLEEINKQRDDMNDAEPNRHRSSIDRSFLALRRPMLENRTVAYYCPCDTCVDTGEPVCICYRCYNQQLLEAKEKQRIGVTNERLQTMLHSGTNGYGDNRSRGGLRSDASTARQKKNLGKRKERS